MPTRVLIADDHGVVRQGLRMFLGADPELEIIGEARDGAEAVRLALELRPDVVLMDLLMPIMDGIRAIAAIRRQAPDIEVVALTSVLEDGSVVDAVRAGAIGYLLKDTEARELSRAIKAAAAGQVQLSPTGSRPTDERGAHAGADHGAVDRTRDGRVATVGPGQIQQRNRQSTAHHRTDRQIPCQSHSRQAGAPQPNASRTVCHADRPGASRLIEAA